MTTVSPAVVLLGGIIALQAYTILYMHQIPISCNCSCPSSTTSNLTSTSNRDSVPTSSHVQQQQQQVQQVQSPTAVRPSSQKPTETAKSTKDLLNELSNINRGQISENTQNSETAAVPNSHIITSNGQTQQQVAQQVQIPPSNSMPQQAINAVQNTVNTQVARPPTTNMRVIDFLNQMHPQGIGIVLGIGRSPFSLDLLQQWRSSPGLYMCDPFIHIWKGAIGSEDPGNVSDKEHQMIFEDLRNKLVMYEGRYSLVRDFSTSFAVTFKGTTGSPPVSLVWVDNNPSPHAAERDLNDWFVTLAPNGIIAGPQYHIDSVRSAVDTFAAQKGLPVNMFQDANTWYIKNTMGPR